MASEYDNGPMGLGEVENGVNADSQAVLRNWLGRRRTFTDLDYSISGLTSGRSQLSGYSLDAICLRNNSGITLSPKMLAQVARSGRDAVKEVIGYGATYTTQGLVLVDPFLPSSGVPNGYIFWGICNAVALCKTPMAGAGFNGDIAAMAPLVCATAAATTGTTAGRVCNVTLPGTTGATDSYNFALSVVGRALSARTTGETNADILVALKSPWVF